MGILGAALGGAAAGLLGGSDKSPRFNQDLFRDWWIEGQQGLKMGNRKPLATFRSILSDIDAGYDKATQSAERTYGGARQRAMDNQERTMGKISSGLAQSGLYNTTLKGNLEMGAASQTNRDLLDIDDMLNRALTGLEVGRTKDMAVAKGQYAGLQQDDARRRERLFSIWMNPLMGQGSFQTRGSNPLLGALGGAAGGISSFYANK